MDGIESLFIWGSSTKYDNVVVFLIVAHWAVWSLCGDVSWCLDFCPFHCKCVKTPYVIHVWRIGITTEVYNTFSNHATTMTPPGWWVRWRLEVTVDFIPNMFFHDDFFLVLFNYYNSKYGTFALDLNRSKYPLSPFSILKS